MFPTIKAATHHQLFVISAMCHICGAGLTLSVVGCTSPTQPGVSVAAARPLGPNAGAQLSYYSQPIVLRLADGAATGSEATATTVEVATNASFAHVVATQGATVAADGLLTVTLAPLAGSTTYYWRAKTTARDNPGALSRVSSFSIGPEVVIEAPVPVQPLSDTFPHRRPTFVVLNATHTGPSDTLTYSFEVATDSAFHSLVLSGTVPEAPTQTSFTPTGDLRSGATYFWRARASDETHGVNGPFSIVQGFTTVNPDDGVWRYTLTLHLVSAEDCRFGYPPPLRDVSFDDGLVVTGDHLRYTVRSDSGSTVALDLIRTTTRVAGTLQGESVNWPGRGGFGVFFDLSILSGSIDNESARLTGTGAGWLSDEGFPNYNQCNRTEVAFTLAPH